MWPSTWRYIRCGVRGYLAQRCCCNRVRYGVCNNHDRRVRDEAGSLISVRLWYGQRSRLRRRWHGLQHSRRRWRLEDCCRGSHSSGIPRPDGHPRFWVLPREKIYYSRINGKNVFQGDIVLADSLISKTPTLAKGQRGRNSLTRAPTWDTWVLLKRMVQLRSGTHKSLQEQSTTVTLSVTSTETGERISSRFRRMVERVG